MGHSTSSAPLDFNHPQYVPNYEKYCLSQEEAEYVYENVKNGTQIKPVHINSKALKECNVNENPYKLALSKDVDDNGFAEPLLEMRKCDLTWSISKYLYRLHHR